MESHSLDCYFLLSNPYKIRAADPNHEFTAVVFSIDHFPIQGKLATTGESIGSGEITRPVEAMEPKRAVADT